MLRGVVSHRCSAARIPRARTRWALVANASSKSERPPEGSSPRKGRSSNPSWWDVGGRLNDAVQRDMRSEHGYLEHESSPVVLFDKRSDFNGRVRVVAHGPWRSLRFNDVEQGLTYVHGNWNDAVVIDDGDDGQNQSSRRRTESTAVRGFKPAVPGPRDGEADTDVLGYFYLRAMAAAAAAMCRLDEHLDLTKRGGRVVCVGLGSGALPAFMARKFPTAVVEVCEIDPVVAEAVRGFHGLNPPKLLGPWGDKPVPGNLPPGVGLCMGDAGEFMEKAARAVERGDAPLASVVFLDAFDGAGEVPSHLTSKDFLEKCDRVLAPGGCVVINLFNGPAGSVQRRRLETIAANLEAVVGAVTTFPVEFPVNVVLAARKERADGFGDQEDPRFTRKELKSAGREISKELQFEWDAGHFLKKAYWVETEGGASFKERPAGLSLNPLSGLVNRMGTAMSDEWAREQEQEM